MHMVVTAFTSAQRQHAPPRCEEYEFVEGEACSGPYSLSLGGEPLTTPMSAAMPLAHPLHSAPMLSSLFISLAQELLKQAAATLQRHGCCAVVKWFCCNKQVAGRPDLV